MNAIIDNTGVISGANSTSCHVTPKSVMMIVSNEAIGHNVNAVGKEAMALLEAIGDVESALPNIDLCINRDSLWSKDHAPESICQVWVLIPQEIY